MLSHDNLTWTGGQELEKVGLRPDDDVSYLPLSHVAEQIDSLDVGRCSRGSCVNLVENLEELPARLREVRPQVFFGVPRVWEKMQAAIERPPPPRRPGGGGSRPGRGGSGSGRPRRPARSPRPWSYGLAKRLVFDRVRERTGTGPRTACAVSPRPSPARPWTSSSACGLPVLEVYGMSECTGPATPPCRAAGARGRPASPSGHRAARGRRRRDPDPRPPRLPGPPEGPGGTPRPWTRTVGSIRAMSGRWTRTASSRSPTARRRSSSRRAGRTSPPRPWRPASSSSRRWRTRWRWRTGASSWPRW